MLGTPAECIQLLKLQGSGLKANFLGLCKVHLTGSTRGSGISYPRRKRSHITELHSSVSDDSRSLLLGEASV